MSVHTASGHAGRLGGLDLLRRFGTAGLLIALVLVFSVTAAQFGSYANITNILGQVAVIGVIGAGMTLVMLVGGIDLSVGSVAILSASVAAALLHHDLAPTGVAIVAAILAGALVGVLNGMLVEGAGINPVIATLGTLIAVRGVAQLILLGDQSSIAIKNGLVDGIGSNRVLGVPVGAVVMLVAFAVVAFLLYRCVYGRWIYAVGVNPVAARLCGVPVPWLRLSTYVLSGSLAAVGGILLAAQVAVVTPPLGLNLEFSVITAVILGGTAITGGVGRVEGTLLGAVMLGMVLNYMTIKGVPGEWQQAVTGLIILVVATLDRLARRGGEPA